MATATLSFSQEKTEFGIYVGYSSRKVTDKTGNVETERARRLDNGWEESRKPPIGGHIGVDVTIPIWSGFFVKPGIYGTYSKEYNMYEKSSTHEGTVPVKDKTSITGIKFVNTTITNYQYEGYTYQDARLVVPVVAGYNYEITERVSAYAGLGAYAGACLLLNQIQETRRRQVLIPDPNGISSDKRDKEDLGNLMKEASFKDRLSYGANVQAGFSFSGITLQYTFLYGLKNLKETSSIDHLVSIGFRF